MARKSPTLSQLLDTLEPISKSIFDVVGLTQRRDLPCNRSHLAENARATRLVAGDCARSQPRFSIVR